MIGRFVFFCLRMAQPEFFRRIEIIGQPLNDRREYLMVVANHPYGVQDAFLLSYAYTRPFSFCATALNFQRRRGDVIRKRRLRGWFMRQCHVLPIVRDRSEGHMSDNFKTFQEAAKRIARGEALGIFAE
jgi:1-acyl-sn-glycerol-3-phosphate acyltransferase